MSKSDWFAVVGIGAAWIGVPLFLIVGAICIVLDK